MRKNTTIRSYIQQGFTVLEMTIYMGILSVLLAVLLTIFSSVLDASLESQGNSTIQQEGRYIMARLSYDIRRASSVNAPVLGVSSSTLQLVLSGLTTNYAQSSNSLLISNTNGIDVLSDYDANISGLTFTTLGNAGGKPMVNISFTLTSKSSRPTAPESATFQTTISTR